MLSATLFPLLALLAAPPAGEPATVGVPFAPGERCTYRGSSRLGRIGTGTLAVEHGEVDGRATYLLRFDFYGRVGVFGIRDESRSWFDPEARASYRFTKHERSPVASRDERVRMDLTAGRWRDEDGTAGPLATPAPLDELSFIYFVRTLPLAEGERHTLARHYDASRNPVRVRVVGRETVCVPAGSFRAVRVEMRVVDPHRYRGEGVIHLHLSDDARRVPLRIESSIPGAGRMVLSLERGSGGCEPAALAPAP